MGLDYPSWACLDIYPYRFDVDQRAQSDRDGAESLSGFVQGVGYLMSAAGPFVFAGLHALTTEWTVAFWFLIATALFPTVAGAFVVRPKFIEDASQA